MGSAEEGDTWRSATTTTPPANATNLAPDDVKVHKHSSSDFHVDGHTESDEERGEIYEEVRNSSDQTDEQSGIPIPSRNILPRLETDNSMDPRSGDSFMTALESPKMALSWGGRKEVLPDDDSNDQEGSSNDHDRATVNAPVNATEIQGDYAGTVVKEPSALPEFGSSSTNLERLESAEAANSFSSLLRHGFSSPKVDSCREELPPEPVSVSLKSPKLPTPSTHVKPLKSAMKKPSVSSSAKDGDEPVPPTPGRWMKERSATGGLVRFKTHDNAVNVDQEMQRRLAHMSRKRSVSLRSRRKVREGEIVKMEKMLVRVEFSPGELSKDYDENESMKVATRVLEKWREHIIVCRETGSKESPLALKIYKTRVWEIKCIFVYYFDNATRTNGQSL